MATWIEYVRHNRRRTKSDAGISETLHRLHRGENPPLVRRMIEREAVPKQAEPPVKNMRNMINRY